MSALAQRTLIQHLADPDSMAVLAREGLEEACVPSEALRPVVAWALNYYHESGHARAPSVEALKAEFGGVLSDYEIPIDEEPEDSIQWAIANLKGTYVHRTWQVFAKESAVAMAEVGITEKVGVLEEAASVLVSIVMDVSSRSHQIDAREGMADRMRAYDARAQDRGKAYGLSLGFPEIDAHIGGIHPGELAVAAAPPKTGKSYLLNKVALNEWEIGRTCCLYTLENSVEMTLDRIACLATFVDSERWRRGECAEAEVQRVREWIERMSSSPNPLWILQPSIGRRTVEAMVREAQLRGADSLLIDQLTFVEHPDPGRKARHEVVRDILHSLKAMISSGSERLPCLLAHQISREGVKAAKKDGRLEMEHMAEAAEVERTADLVCGMWQSQEQRAIRRMKLQLLAGRRVDLADWELTWNLMAGVIKVFVPADLGGTARPREAVS